MSDDDKSQAISDVVSGMNPDDLYGGPEEQQRGLNAMTLADLDAYRPDLVKEARRSMPGMPKVDLDWSSDMRTIETLHAFSDEGDWITNQINLFEHGFVRLEGMMGQSETVGSNLDLSIVNAAKVSFADRATSMGDREKAILRYLISNRHGSPLEHVVFNFTVRGPLFVFYEWHRHRAGHSYNEESARYTTMRSDFRSYKAGEITTQVGRPGRYTFEPMSEIDEFEDGIGMSGRERATEAESIMDLTQRFAFRQYNELLKLGVAPQQARVVLPVGTYKEQVWTCNARSLLHFLSLRMDANAQDDIRRYAHAIYRLVEPFMPLTMDAFRDRGWVAP